MRCKIVPKPRHCAYQWMEKKNAPVLELSHGDKKKSLSGIFSQAHCSKVQLLDHNDV